jgi:hypothetical protein
MLKLLQTAFYDLIRTLRILFHEAMGAVFLVIGIVITLNGYKQVRRFIDFGEISYVTIISTFTFGILRLRQALRPHESPTSLEDLIH